MRKAKKPAAKVASRKFVRTSKTTAVAAPQESLLRIQVNDPSRMLESLREETVLANVLGDDASVGTLGMTEVQLSAEAEAELAKPVSLDDVLVKPDGIAYLPHAKYTAWFNRAFGRFGWAIVPKAKPVKAQTPHGFLIVVPYVLYVHQRPVAFAQGEQEWQEGNKKQSYGDAVEATVASGLRRLAKRIGVGLELWDKAFLRRFLEERCHPVETQYGTKWRLKTEPPLPEESNSRKPAARPAARPAEAPKALPPAGADHQQDEVITQAQRQRLATIVERRGRNAAEVSLWLKRVYNIKNSTQIKRRDYDTIVAALEAKGELAMPGDGEVVG